jgi:hypothetical protein
MQRTHTWIQPKTTAEYRQEIDHKTLRKSDCFRYLRTVWLLKCLVDEHVGLVSLLVAVGSEMLGVLAKAKS